MKQPDRLVITGCGILSPIGIGLEAFTTAWQDQRNGRVSLSDLFDDPLPCEEAAYITGFNVRDYLGKKGTSFLDRLSAFTIVTCGMALENANLTIDAENQDQVGVVLGSSVGSIQSISEFTRETLIHDRPYLVNPVLFPNTVMNCAAGQAAIWHLLKNMNSTVSNGQLSSLAALRYAMLALRRGYVKTLLFGAAEAFSPHLAWGMDHAGTLAATPTPLGEGCALFTLEKAAVAAAAGRPPLLDVLACEVGVYENPEAQPDATAAGLAACINRALQKAGIAPHEVWAQSGSFTGHTLLDQVETEGTRLALGHLPARQLKIKQLLGECYSAAGAFQLAALLALYHSENNAQTTGKAAIVTATGHDGAVGCAVLKEG